MTNDEHVGVRNRRRDPSFLAALDEVVEQDGKPSAGACLEACHPICQIISTLELFDDNSLDP